MLKIEEENLKKSERTRLHLIETAFQAFRDRGYDCCTMRELAIEAGVTAPAFYYYFRSKEEIVSSFYQDSLRQHLRKAEAQIDANRPLTENLKQIILQRFNELSKNREALSVLRRYSFDRSNELSPFHKNHRGIRKSSVDMFAKLVENAKLKWRAKDKRDFAQLLWLFHLLIIFYWIGDESAGQKKSKELLQSSLSHLSTALLLLRLPGSQRTLSPILKTLKKADLLEDL